MPDDQSFTLSGAEFAAILRRHPWILTVDPYAELSRGWRGLYVEMLDDVARVVARIAADHAGVRLRDWSTKQKLGGLRVHFRLVGAPKAVLPLLSAPVATAELKSRQVCEVCGAPGRLREMDEWLTTRCDAHADEPEDASS